MLALLDRLLRYLLIISIAVLTTSVFLQVIVRFILKSPLPWTEEAARIAFVYSIFIGATIGVRQKAHINVDAIVFFMPKTVQKVLALFSSLAVGVFLCVWIWQGTIFVLQTGIQMTPVLLIPFQYLYLVIPISGALMLFYLGINVVDDLRGARTP